MDKEAKFKELFQKIIDQCELSSTAAGELLQKILIFLNPLPQNSKYEILKEHSEREDNL